MYHQLEFLNYFFIPHLRMCLLILQGKEGREEERERKKKSCEKHQCVASHKCPNWGLNLQTSAVLDDAPTN